MRVVLNPQMQIGQVDISKIEIDSKSRDDIPKILRGLQHLYQDLPLRKALFELLEERIAPTVDKRNGRPGMALWPVFVCGVLRLDLNIDYDRLLELVNHHNTIRAMLGHSEFDEWLYQFQTLKDNVRLLTPELLEEINVLVINAGHVLVKKKDGEALRGRCDSFVVETDVHYPTDINLLYDAMRKIITLTAQWCDRHNLSDWRQHKHHLRNLKRLMRTAQNKKRSKAQSEAQQKKNAASIIVAHQAYLEGAEQVFSKAQATLILFEQQGYTSPSDVLAKQEIAGFMQHALRQIDQTKRRVILGETIPHDEKVFSIFEPHTEWISKGKAGVAVELGLRTCVVEDQHRFILHHQVMERTTDDAIAVHIVEQTKQRFDALHSVSMDKGFHSVDNQAKLRKIVDVVVMPKKGRLSVVDRERESDPEFVTLRRQHSAVESAINALESHGLDLCPDHGIVGFKRYVAIAVLARNIQRLGAILRQQASDRMRGPYKKAA